jgi:hypothetical protein
MGADNNKSTMGTLLTWIFTAVLVIVAIKVVFWILGVALGLSALLLMIAMKVLPLVLVGWLALKLYRAFFCESRGEESDAF